VTSRQAEIKNLFLDNFADAKTELIYENLYELLVSVMLSAQCTDKRVNIITPALFKMYPSVVELAIAKLDDVKKLINSCSFFNNKAKNLISMANTVIENFGSIIPLSKDELVTLAASEGGKPLMDSQVEVRRAIDGVKNCIECIRTEHGTEIPMQLNPASANRVAFTRKEPIGIVVAFSAFNHPLNLIVHQVGPAVATGCPVIIKPAEDTPLSAFMFVDLLREAGLPDAWCQPLLTTSHDVSGKLVSDKRTAFFSFIGSGKVGWMLRSQLANGTRCALEHGGAAPVIITEDADLEDVLPLLAKGGFYHAGQVCVSVQRVFAPAIIAQKVAEKLAQTM